MTRLHIAFATAALLVAAPCLRAEELQDTSAFERAYAVSLYEFDGCGDGLTGRQFRNALNEKLRNCPFSAEARSRYAARAAAQRRKSSAAIQRLIDQTGGLPVQLDGMAQTCREQRDSVAFQQLSQAMQQYSAGQRDVNSVIPAGCDAQDVLP